nr:formyltransferase family protein [Solitalea agri]
MKILLITSGHNLLAQKLLFDQSVNIVGVAFPVKNTKNQQLKHKISFNIRNNFIKLKRFLTTAKQLPHFVFSKENENQLLDWIKSLKPDLIISYSSPFLFDSKIMSLAPKGIINVHNSLLPNYRGPQPFIWQYLNHDLKHGVTVLYLGEKEDAGDIITQQSFVIKNGEPQSSTLKKCENIGYDLVLKSIELIKKNKVEKIKQPEKATTKRAKRISESEIIKLINWNEWSTEHINHVVKGLGLSISEKEIEALSKASIKTETQQLTSAPFTL